MRSLDPAAPTTRRCAIYTRKSSDEGLEQAFNSLHAQRAACEAYIASQVGEGWTCLPQAYDDGGVSGATMERAGLKRLLDDVRAKRIDVVVVYKVDRLSRSLGDFARIVEVFDEAGASFVSVTQAFNTTSSMGRLTLNVLLSFAQFEREVTGERIRDKIALSKQKGMWMGGVPPLGYDARDHKLVANITEAQCVRSIFSRYLELGSVHILRDTLEREGVRSKLWITRDGKVVGGAVLTRGALYHLLSNRTYLGEIVHRDATYPGLHEAIVPQTLFDRVQSAIAANRVQRRARRVKPAQAWLTGKVFDGEGRAFSPTFSTGRLGRIHRYYVRSDLQQGACRAGEREGAIRRVAADALEQLVGRALRNYCEQPHADIANLAPMLIRLEMRPNETHMVLDPNVLFGSNHPKLAAAELKARLTAGEELVFEDDDRRLRIAVPRRLQLRGGRTWRAALPYPARVVDPVVIDAFRRAHRLSMTHRTSSVPPNSYDRKLMQLAYLAPDLQRRLVAGRLHISLAELLRNPPPLAWDEQRNLFSSDY